ncbi:MAG: hypothetical protein GY798_21210, partial [Hyphomicrobiales bacterium]|nr:hypothetical protein [Hyphomicrobiales bacterium]
GAVSGNGFTVTVAMTSLLGCSGDDFASVLRSLGYRMERKPKPERPEDEKLETRSGDGEEPSAIPGDAATESAMPETLPATPPASAAAAGAAGLAGAAIDPVAGASEDARAPDRPPDIPASAPTPASAEVSPSESPPVNKPAPANPDPDAVPQPSSGAPLAVEAHGAIEPTGALASPDVDAPPDTPSPEPEFIEVWRPQRSRRPGGRSGGAEAQSVGRRRRRDNTKSAADGHPERPETKPRRRSRGPDKTREHERSQRKNRPGQPSTRRPGRPDPAKTADPDSPFAALAALKAELESQGPEDS